MIHNELSWHRPPVRSRRSSIGGSALACLGTSLLAAPLGAQVSVSIDQAGPTISVPDTTSGVPITQGDILVAATLGPLPAPGPLPPPGIWITGGFGAGGPNAPGLGLLFHAGCVGAPPGAGCPAEVDALSYGVDWNLDPVVPYQPGGNLWFSVDEWAVGLIGNPFVPSTLTESAVGDAAADVFVEFGLIPGPLPPGAMGPLNAGAIDGDGTDSANLVTSPGLGLIEPTGPFPPPTPGDDVDALDVHSPLSQTLVFFSLDSGFPDPLTGLPNTGSAAAHGFVGGDVLVTPVPLPGVAPVLWASAMQLGLDLVAGPDTDDLDALVLWENGSGVFDPSQQPYDWATGATDMLLFSVRRGSAVIGAPDSFFGIPICEGDLLTTPFLGGVSPYPAIFVAAENLGLATMRGGLSDDLDGADSSRTPVFDCDLNGIEDAVDIALGFAGDANQDGAPDPCQLVTTPYCFGAACPCGNDSLTAGCLNGSGSGALMTASGTTVHALDDLVLTTSGVPPNQNGLFYMGPIAVKVPFANGHRCAAPGALGLFRYPIQNAGPAGILTLGPGIIATSCASFTPSGCIQPGFTWNFQAWYRDPLGPCGATFNFSSAVQATFVP
jgi:hypothetical protein